jgi:hypothetical protein
MIDNRKLEKALVGGQEPQKTPRTAIVAVMPDCQVSQSHRDKANAVLAYGQVETLEILANFIALAEWVKSGEHHSACSYRRNPISCDCQVQAAKEVLDAIKYDW